MPTFLMIRHAENEFVKEGRLAGRLPDVHLNDRGREQANELAQSLRKAPIQAVYASPLERTLETAEPIARALDIEVTPHDGLLEIDFGDWQGEKLEKLKEQELWKTVQGSPTRTRFPNGETFADAQYRVVKALEKLCEKHDPKDVIVCIAHSDIIKLAAAYYLGVPMDLFQRLMIAPASITTIHIGEGFARVIHINHSAALKIPTPKEEEEETPPENKQAEKTKNEGK